MTIIVSSNDVYKAFTSMPSTPILTTDATIDRNLWQKVISCEDDVHKRAYFFIIFMTSMAQACKEIMALTSDESCLFGDQIGKGNVLGIAHTIYRHLTKELCADNTKNSGSGIIIFCD